MGAILGDAIHNMRSALDLMAVSLVDEAKGNTNGVYFPFAESGDELDPMIKRRNFHRAPEEAVDLLRTLAPYKGGNVALRAIHDLDIEDKHKTLIPHLAMTTTPELSMVGSIADGTVELVMAPGAAPTVEFLFPEGTGLHGQPIIPTLHELVKLVSGILDTFEAIIA